MILKRNHNLIKGNYTGINFAGSTFGSGIVSVNIYNNIFIDNNTSLQVNNLFYYGTSNPDGGGEPVNTFPVHIEKNKSEKIPIYHQDINQYIMTSNHLNQKDLPA